jgi:heme ABC exporter ATP-binding subunit CcmA
MVDVDDLHKAYDGEPVLQGASFSVGRGTVAMLVGSNGTGKTTTLRVLAGLTDPDAGTVRIDGADVTQDRQAAQRRLAFLPQEVRFHAALTPRQVLRFYADVRGRADPRRVDALLEEVGLTGAAGDPCETLSGGMRQRLGLAVVWLADAPVLLLDEPGLSLDPEWRAYLKRELRRRADAGTTVLLATHLVDTWTDVADTRLRCREGLVEREEIGETRARNVVE